MSGVQFYKDARANGLTLDGHRLVLKPWTPPKRTTGLPGKTLESVAACAALDLTYWSDHPQSRLVWAADLHGRFHEVEVDRKTGVAQHYCGKSRRLGSKGELLDTTPCADAGRRVSWAKPPTMADLFVMLGSDTVPELPPMPEPANPNRDYGEPLASDLAASEDKGPLGYCVHGRHSQCTHSKGGAHYRKGLKLSDGTRYHCPCECHRDGFTLPTYTAAERRIIKDRTQRREAQRDKEMEEMSARFLAEARAKHAEQDQPRRRVSTNTLAISLIVANPALIPNLHTDYLLDALGHTDHDEQITAELHNRGITTTSEAS